MGLELGANTRANVSMLRTVPFGELDHSAASITHFLFLENQCVIKLHLIFFSPTHFSPHFHSYIGSWGSLVSSSACASSIYSSVIAWIIIICSIVFFRLFFKYTALQLRAILGSSISMVS